MNQTILENLMKQSMPEIDWKARYYVDLNNGEKLQHNQEWFSKFAELILEDVLRIVGNGGEFCSRPKLMEQLKTHFGVEE